MIQLLQGNFADGWRNFEWRTLRKENATRRFSQPLWLGEPLHGARILLHAEQGLDDDLQFLRYLPMVQAAGGAVVLDILPGCAGLPGSSRPRRSGCLRRAAAAILTGIAR